MQRKHAAAWPSPLRRVLPALLLLLPASADVQNKHVIAAHNKTAAANKHAAVSRTHAAAAAAAAAPGPAAAAAAAAHKHTTAGSVHLSREHATHAAAPHGHAHVVPHRSVHAAAGHVPVTAMRKHGHGAAGGAAAATGARLYKRPAASHSKSDAELLLALKAALGADNKALATWRRGTDPCGHYKWLGVACAAGHVVGM